MYKTVTIDKAKYEEVYEGPARGRFEFALRAFPKTYGRKDKVQFEYKRCIFEPDMHLGEMTAFKIAEKLGIPCCEVELFSKQHPTMLDIFETGCISYFEVGSDDVLYSAENLISTYAKEHGISSFHLIDIDSIFCAIYDFLKRNNRPLEEYFKFKRDFITMTFFDLKFGNFDRGINNWFVRVNKTTGVVELYPMFDNEAILGFTDDILENMSYTEISKFNNERKSKVYTNFKDMYEYLLKHYPFEMRHASMVLSSFKLEDLESILNNLPGISDKRKEFARKNYAYRTIELDRIKTEYEDSVRVKRAALRTVNFDERMSS